jgi:acyl-coenzyme A synthetase/AMP-(fatty) acid ligase/thioesterase domain-containing protein/aryl carrier-like protein
LDNQTLEPRGTLLRTLVDAVEMHPDRIALQDSEQSLTYSELALQLKAFASAAMSLQRESSFSGYVPIFVGRDVESAVAILSCFLYSIPFSPVDADWPKETLSFIMDKLSDPPFALASTKVSELASSKVAENSNIVSINGLKFSNEPLRGIASLTHSDKGFVLFTSGTTGYPKGVEFDQKATTEQCKYFIRREVKDLELVSSPVNAVLGFPLNFSAGIGRLVGGIIGNSTRILSETELGVVEFCSVANNFSANVLRLPPSLLVLMSGVGNFSPPLLPGVELVSFGGDSVSFATIHKLKDYFKPATEMVAGFAATEGMSGLSYRFTLAECPRTGPIPVGRSASVTKAMMEALPEMEGHFVLLNQEPIATRYLAEPVLTAERFRTDSHGKRSWYSGDILYADDKGNIWHKGRVDDLVKIRGKLSSPSEATRALLQIPGVMDAVVLPDLTKQSARLVAHVAFHPGSSLELSEIRRKLISLIPANLIPALFIVHDSIPKNSRGKADRKLLSEGQWAPLELTPGPPATTKTEIRVSRDIQAVLGVPAPSIDASLLEMGFDSLAALELESRLRDDFPDIDLDVLSQNQTIRAMARALDHLQLGDDTLKVVLNPKGSLSPFYAFPGEGERATHFAQLARALGRETPIHCLLASRVDSSGKNTTVFGRVSSALAQLGELSESHVRLAGYSYGGIFAYELAKRLIADGKHVELLLLDTDFSLAQKKTRALSARLRVGQSVKQAGKAEVFRPMKIIVYVFRRHGFKRATYLIFFVQPLELIMSRPLLRKMLGDGFGALPPGILRRLRKRLTESRIRHEVADYEAVPMSEEEGKFLTCTFAYSQESTNHERWRRLIPSVTFIESEGRHIDMLNYPHVESLVRNLAPFAPK